MNENNKTTNIDLDIQHCINLKNMVGNRHAAEMALAYIDDYYYNRDIPFLKPVLLVGKNTCKTFAAALSNSFGNDNDHFYYVCGSFFSSGIFELNNYYAYTEVGGCCDTFFIANIEKLNLLNQYKLGRIFYKGRINYIDRNSKLPISAPLRKHLHILSARNISEINKPLLDQMGIILNIAPLTEDEIFQVLKQRAKLMNLTVESEDILIKIAQGCVGLVHRAVELLSLACCLMRAADENILTKKHVDRALYLDEKNTDAYLKNDLL